MNLNHYQQQALLTCMPTCHNVTYMLGNLTAEVGELAGKVAKMVRKGHAVVQDNHLTYPPTVTDQQVNDFLREIALEAGDVLWQLSGLCSAFNLSLDEVAQLNLRKLADRQQRGVIDGNGDHR